MAQRDVQLPRSFRSTHDTAGLPAFPAVDVFAQPGEPVLAPEAGRLVYPHMIPWDTGKRVGGETVYLQGADGNTYFLTHLAGDITAGPVKAGQPIGQVAAVPGGAWQPHIHEGLHQGLYQPGGSSSSSSSPVAPTVTAALAAPAAAPTPTPAPVPQPAPIPQPQMAPVAVPDTRREFASALLAGISPTGQLSQQGLVQALMQRPRMIWS